MRVTELTNLWVAKNISENFTVLIAALDKKEAMDIAREYFNEADIWYSSEDCIEISEFTDLETKFDCDYVLTYSRNI